MLSYFSHVWFFATLWTVACQVPLSMEILQARILGWVAISSSRVSSQLRDWIQVSCTAGGLYLLSHQGNYPSKPSHIFMFAEGIFLPLKDSYSIDFYLIHWTILCLPVQFILGCKYAKLPYLALDCQFLESKQWVLLHFVSPGSPWHLMYIILI